MSKRRNSLTSKEEPKDKRTKLDEEKSIQNDMKEKDISNPKDITKIKQNIVVQKQTSLEQKNPTQVPSFESDSPKQSLGEETTDSMTLFKIEQNVSVNKEKSQS